MNTSVCRNKKCKRPIFFSNISGQWLHGYKNLWGDWYVEGAYCKTVGGFTASPLMVATPVLHDEEVPVL